MIAITSSLCPNNERQWSENNFRPSILETQGAVRLHLFIIELSASFLAKYAYVNIMIMSQNERERSVNGASP